MHFTRRLTQALRPGAIKNTNAGFSQSDFGLFPKPGSFNAMLLESFLNSSKRELFGDQQQCLVASQLRRITFISSTVIELLPKGRFELQR